MVIDTAIGKPTTVNARAAELVPQDVIQDRLLRLADEEPEALHLVSVQLEELFGRQRLGLRRADRAAQDRDEFVFLRRSLDESASLGREVVHLRPEMGRPTCKWAAGRSGKSPSAPHG